MRIAIITQPLFSNYGGLLQNWALQTVLHQQYPGAEILTFDQVDSLAPLYLRVGSMVKHWLMGRKAIIQRTSFDEFRDKHIKATAKARSLKDFIRYDRHYTPDVYVVGSDQVWRPSMVLNLDANFLSFTKCSRKIAYAASFGINTWEFTPRQTNRCRKLIKDFTAVSVRERDGMELCTRYFNCKAQHVLDPTLLLKAEDYLSLILEAPVNVGEYAFTYILDSDDEKRSVVKSLIGNLPECNAANDVNGKLPQKRLSVEQWLQGIRNAKIVICDSFHGVAFSIIFNKDFWVLLNPNRGNSRIMSILKLFGLEQRIVPSIDRIGQNTSTINWTEINNRREALVHSSIQFLREALKQ